MGSGQCLRKKAKQEESLQTTQLHTLLYTARKKMNKYHLWVVGFVFFTTLPYIFLMLYTKEHVSMAQKEKNTHPPPLKKYFLVPTQHP